jgi:uncharacterized membrane protein
MWWVRIPLVARGTTLSDKVCQWIAVSSTNKTDRHDMTEILLIEWVSMLENNERTCTTRIGEYVRIEWATMHEKSEWACITRMGEYVRIEWATILGKSEWACTSRNERVCTDRMRHYA